MLDGTIYSLGKNYSGQWDRNNPQHAVPWRPPGKPRPATTATPTTTTVSTTTTTTTTTSTSTTTMSTTTTTPPYDDKYDDTYEEETSEYGTSEYDAHGASAGESDAPEFYDVKGEEDYVSYEEQEYGKKSDGDRAKDKDELFNILLSHAEHKSFAIGCVVSGITVGVIRKHVLGLLKLPVCF